MTELLNPDEHNTGLEFKSRERVVIAVRSEVVILAVADTNGLTASIGMSRQELRDLITVLSYYDRTVSEE